MGDVETRLRDSWVANADSWTRAVRDGRIPSRRAGTDAAVVALCAELLAARPGGTGAGRPRALDVGCGEGWLTRALAERGADALGIDASPPLIEAARAAGGEGAAYEVASYDDLVADAGRVAGPFDLVACNFALLGDPVAPLLAALRRRLSAGGALVVQTVHPWVAVGDGPYEGGWREERFAAFDEPFPSSMPWYFRTLGAWLAELAAAGLVVRRLDEPLHPETRRPLSLLLHCTAAA